METETCREKSSYGPYVTYTAENKIAKRNSGKMPSLIKLSVSPFLPSFPFFFFFVVVIVVVKLSFYSISLIFLKLKGTL